MMNYRQRCYAAYDLQWEQFHSSSKEEFEFYSKVSKKKFLPFLPIKKTSKILDVACGAGHFLYFLKKEGYTDVYGIDLSKEQLEIAKKMGITEVEEIDLFDYLHRHPEKYEMIVAFDIIEHLTKDEVFEFLDALYSALQPGGKVLIGTINAASLFGSGMVYMDFTHEQGFTPASLAQVLKLSGFENVGVYGHGPVAHDFRSLIRVWLWKTIKDILRTFLMVERGTGRGLWKHSVILEPAMFAVVQKPSEQAKL